MFIIHNFREIHQKCIRFLPSSIFQNPVGRKRRLISSFSFAMSVLLMSCVLSRNSLARPIPFQVYHWFEFSFPSRLVAIPKLKSSVCPYLKGE